MNTPHVVLRKFVWFITILFSGVLLLVSCHSNNATTPINSQAVKMSKTTIPAATSTPNKLKPTKTADSSQAITPTVQNLRTIIPPESCPPFTPDSGLPEPDTPENYVGRHYQHRDLPEGLEIIEENIIRDEVNAVEYGFTKLKWRQNRMFFWLEQLVCRDRNGYPYHEIIDVIASPPLSGEETFAWVCFQENNKIDNLVALGIYDEKEPLVTIGSYTGWQYKEIVFAFVVNINEGKFEKHRTEDLTCLHALGR